MKDDAFFTTHIADGDDVLNDTDFIVHMHDADQRCVGADGIFQFVQVEQTIFLHVHISDFKTLTLKFTHGVEHGFVLGFHGDQVFAFGFVKLRCAFDGQVVGFGST